MRRSIFPVASLGLLALVLLVAQLAVPPARAQEVPRLTGRVTDLANVQVRGGEVETALRDLEDDRGVQLWVLFVETTGSSSVTQFADAVAAANSLGGNDALLVVAMEDRTDALWVGPLLTAVSDQEIDQLLARELEPRLADGDVTGAMIALAQGLGDAAGRDATSKGDGGGDGVTILVVLGVVVVLAAVAGAIVWLVRRARSRRATEERDRETGQLAKQANVLLLEVDDGLREARAELGFAEAQFSEPDVVPVRQALDAARTELQAAFTLRQKLDDDQPEAPLVRRTMLEQLIGHAEKAKGFLAEQRDRIEQLRDLERTAPAVLDSLAGQAEQIESRLPAAEERFATLQSYADALSKPLEGNAVEARKRLAFAREAAAAGAAAMTAGQRSKAAQAARAGEAAIAEAAALLVAIDRQAEAVQQARNLLTQELAASEADLASARAAVASGKVKGADESLARAEALLESARQEAAAARPDPLAARRMVQEADASTDAVLSGLRATEERSQRERAAFEASFHRAETAYQQAADYILARRGIGREARTRLAEAERRLEGARRAGTDDIAYAASEAKAAERLASEALRLAQADFGDYDRRRPPGGVPDVMGGVLGGVLGSILLGGSRGRGGFGGTTWGGPSRSRSRGGSFRLPTGFGGSGGRSRGGRW